ncbi:MAG: hypothetical protein PHN93_00510 [Sphaerochaetaceae bacterium]|nr:hypothetical protein [Sphaerochaetaceae bacterium]
MLSSRIQPVEQLAESSWFPFSDEPVIQGLWYVPRLSCPVFLFPEDAPDGKWHLFAHSWLGIQHYVSGSGIMWEPMGLVQVRGKYPFLFKEKGAFHIIYERHGRRIPFVEHVTKRMKKSYVVGSHIEMRSSNDLSVWSEPRILLEAKDIPSASDYRKTPTVSHPQVIPAEGGYRMYVGSSKIGSDPASTRYVCTAFSETLDGRYVPESLLPLVEAVPNDPFRSLGTGRMCVYKGNDSYVAIQNSRYWDAGRKRHASAIVLLTSSDGLQWQRAERDPVLVPAERGWASEHIMSSDVRYKQDEACWYCYFSATGERRFGLVRESIGLLIGKPRAPRKPSSSPDSLFEES